MADDNSHVSKVLEGLIEEVVSKLLGVQADLVTINALEQKFGLPVTMLADLIADDGALLGNTPTSVQVAAIGVTRQVVSQTRRPGTQIRADEYLGEEPMEAAKKYIKSMGQAVKFEDIASAVERGGAAIRGADWKERLEISLKRSPYQVITVSEGTYGLSDFYTEEQLNRLKASRKPSGASNSKKQKSKAAESLDG